MNQGARDANAESARLAGSRRMDDVLAELERMNVLLLRIVNALEKPSATEVKLCPTGYHTS